MQRNKSNDCKASARQQISDIKNNFLRAGHEFYFAICISLRSMSNKALKRTRSNMYLVSPEVPRHDETDYLRALCNVKDKDFFRILQYRKCLVRSICHLKNYLCWFFDINGGVNFLTEKNCTTGC